MTARHAAVPAPVGLPDPSLAPVPPAPQAPRTAPLPTSPPLHIQPDRRESDLRRDGNRQKLTHSDHEVYRGLHEGGRDGLAIAVALPPLDQVGGGYRCQYRSDALQIGRLKIPRV